MNLDNNNNYFSGLTKSRGTQITSWRFYLSVLSIGLLVVVLIGYGFHLGNSMVAKYTPLINATMEIKLEATTAHLWFEEIISGDRFEDINAVKQHLDQAQWYAMVMLEGGERPEGKFIPLKDPVLRREIEEVSEKINTFRKITDQRFKSIQDSGIGTMIDQQYDKVFRDFLSQVGRTESILQSEVGTKFQVVKIIQITLILASFLLIGIIVWMFHRFERHRASDIQLLQTTNEYLEKALQVVKTLSGCSLAVTHASTEQELLDEVCRVVVEAGGYELAWIGYAEYNREKTIRIAAKAGDKLDYLKSMKVSWADNNIGRGPVGTAIRTASISVLNEVEKDPRFAPWFESAKEFGLKSVVALPLILLNEPVGVLTICSSEINSFSKDELVLLEMLSRELAYGIKVFRAEKKRKEVENNLRFLGKAVNTTTMGITITDTKGNILYSNPTDARTHGYSVEELVGKNANIFAPTNMRRSFNVGDMKNNRKRESINITKSGRCFPVNLLSDVVENEEGVPVGFVTTCEDISDRKQAEEELKKSREELRNLVSHLETIREEERKKIARDIHDDLGQLLTAFSFDLKWINKSLNKDQVHLKKKIAKSLIIVDHTIEFVQKISSDLRPAVLDNLGIVAGIEWQMKEFHNRTGIKYTLKIKPDQIALGSKISVEIFRIFQELLTNVARHSEAANVNIHFEVIETRLTLKVNDDGKGIREEQVSATNSLGLIGIRERILPYKGSIAISGKTGKGTMVTVDIPLNEPE